MPAARRTSRVPPETAGEWAVRDQEVVRAGGFFLLTA